MLRYKYAPVDSDSDEIRLLTILPGEFQDEVRITLHTTVLTENSVLEFEALSYAWGSTESQAKITVIDREKKASTKASSHRGFRLVKKAFDLSLRRQIYVTQNLAEALPYLRLRDEERVMWIDAVCVNQQDRVERSKQVQRMANIFSLAKSVVVWLGLEGDDSRCALPIFTEIASHVEVDSLNYKVKPSTRADVDGRWSDVSGVIPLERAQSMHLVMFLDRSWFSRLWIWQEILLATDSAVLMCGRSTLRWKHLQAAILCLTMGLVWFERRVAARMALKRSVSFVSQLCLGNPSTSFCYLMIQTQCQECSDPRDRVFALLSLMREKINIRPDYTKSTGEVYRGFTMEYITGTSDFDLLQLCVMLELPVPCDLPTWVPEFSENIPKKEFALTSSTDKATNDVRFPNEKTLSLLGVWWARVESVQQLGLTERGDPNLLAIVRKLAPPSVAAAESAYVSGGTCFDTFYRLICGHRIDEEPPNHVDTALNHALPGLFDAIYHPHESSEVPDAARDHIEGKLFEKAFFQTVEGHIALGPETAQPGDEVVCLLGCVVPFLLRPDDKNCYRIVGACTVAGLMDHEGVLGPLPARVKRVIRFDERANTYWNAWRNEATGELLMDDPRWSPPPAGWTVRQHDQEHIFTWYENLETGEGKDKYVNTSLRWEMLRDRGVRLERFNLI